MGCLWCHPVFKTIRNMMPNLALHRLFSQLPKIVFSGALLSFVVAIGFALSAAAKNPFIILQSTTSTQNSGLYEHILPLFTARTGIDVRVVAVGTGQALRNAEKCDGDVLIVHSTADEIAFVEKGFGTKRHDLMYNDFVILGPANDPAAIKSATTVNAALQKIVSSQSRFASRGDNSGTHKAERRLWNAANLVPETARNQWYLETGLGMGATLNFAVQADAYTLSDRATWLAFANRGNHQILFQGYPPLFNQYGVVPVSQTHCPNVKQDFAEEFTSWLVSPEGQKSIASFRRSDTQLFFPNAD
jgi:tungstate transport system substrate-binding protein